MSAGPPTSSPPPGAQPIWGSYAGGSYTTVAPSEERSSRLALPGFGAEPLTPLSQRLMHGVKFLSLLLILVLANSFLNSSEENPLNPVAAAAERTQSEPGARFTMKAIYTSAALPKPLAAHGRGSFNTESGRSRVILRLKSAERGRVKIEALSDGTSVFMRGTGISGELPGGKEWMEMQPFLGHSEQEAMLSGGDADDTLEMLATVDGNVREMGREEIRGVPTRRYRTSVELTEYAELLRDEGKDELADQYEKIATLVPGPVVGEASIDAEGIVRRSRVVMTLPTEPGKPTMTMDMRMEFFAFGARPQIALPDDSQVFDVTPLLEEQLDEIETE